MRVLYEILWGRDGGGEEGCLVVWVLRCVADVVDER